VWGPAGGGASASRDKGRGPRPLCPCRRVPAYPPRASGAHGGGGGGGEAGPPRCSSPAALPQTTAGPEADPALGAGELARAPRSTAGGGQGEPAPAVVRLAHPCGGLTRCRRSRHPQARSPSATACVTPAGFVVLLATHACCAGRSARGGGACGRVGSGLRPRARCSRGNRRASGGLRLFWRRAGARRRSVRRRLGSGLRGRVFTAWRRPRPLGMRRSRGGRWRTVASAGASSWHRMGRTIIHGRRRGWLLRHGCGCER